MFDDKILSPGEKLKFLRKMYKLKQEDISGDYISRAMVSNIERGFSRLKKDKAKIFVDNFHKKVNDVDVNYVTVEWLLESETDQLLRILENYKEKLRHIKVGNNRKEKVLNLLHELDQLFLKYNISDVYKTEIYSLAADIFVIDGCLEEGELYILEAIFLSFYKQNFMELIKNVRYLSYLYSKKHDYDGIILTSKIVEHFKNIKSSEIYNCLENNVNVDIIYYNTALAYKNLGDFDNCIYYINLLENNPNLRKDIYYNTYLLKGSLYIDYKIYDEAELIYYKILSSALNDSEAFIISFAYLNLAQISIFKNDLNSAEDFAEKASEINILDDYSKSFCAYHLFNIYLSTNNINKVLILYKGTLDLLIKIQDKDLELNFINNLVKFFVDNKLFANLNDFIEILYDKVLGNMIELPSLVNIFLEVSALYKPLNKKKFEKIFDQTINVLHHFTKTVLK